MHILSSQAFFQQVWGWEPRANLLLSPLGFHHFLFPISHSLSLSIEAQVLGYILGVSEILSDSFSFLHCIWDNTLSIKPADQSKCCLISFMHPAHTGFQPPCVVLPMNLNLVPKQLPSIILAATANSSPASHFSPLKKPFFLLAATELPRSLAREMISQQACGPGAFHRLKVGMDACVYLCVYCI